MNRSLGCAEYRKTAGYDKRGLRDPHFASVGQGGGCEEYGWVALDKVEGVVKRHST